MKIELKEISVFKKVVGTLEVPATQIYHFIFKYSLKEKLRVAGILKMPTTSFIILDFHI